VFEVAERPRPRTPDSGPVQHIAVRHHEEIVVGTTTVR
jgi:hypothetical protein